MNLETISTRLLYTTVPIWAVDDKDITAIGTGFLFNYTTSDNLTIPFIVTNFHVIKNSKRVITEFAKKINGKPSKDKIRVEITLDTSDIFGDEKLDLYLIPIAPTITQVEQSGTHIFYVSLDQSIIPSTETIEELSAIEEITFIGYPSGIYDDKNILPIARRGITATPIWNNFRDQRKFLIDAGVYPGSSGSPVFILNQGSFALGNEIALGHRILFIGILSESNIDYMDSGESSKYFLGLGSVIKTEVLMNFMKSVAERITKA